MYFVTNIQYISQIVKKIKENLVVMNLKNFFVSYLSVILFLYLL